MVLDAPPGAGCMSGGVPPCGLSAGAPPVPVEFGPVQPCGWSWPLLSGNTVRPVTVAMFNFVSVEQTLWAKLAAVSVLAMLPVVVLGIIAQKNIVKGLTVGAVKGGGRR